MHTYTHTHTNYDFPKHIELQTQPSDFTPLAIFLVVVYILFISKQ